MRPLLRRFLLLTAMACAVLAPLGQVALAQAAKVNGDSAPPSPAPGDSLGRETPSGTLYGFLQAAQTGNYRVASEYLQFRPTVREPLRLELAEKLKAVLDRAFVGNLKNLSTQPEGANQPGLPPDQQKVGNLVAGDAETELILVRVTDPASGRVWLFSQPTLEKVPDLYDQLQARQVEKNLPESLVRITPLGMPLWQWLAILLVMLLAGAAGWLLVELVFFPQKLWARRTGRALVVTRRSAFFGPLWLIVSIFLHSIAVSYIRLPLLHRHYYFRTAYVAFIMAVTWLALCVVTRVLHRVRDRAIAYGQTGTGSLVLLGQRIFKVGIFIIGALAVLGALGFNLTTALAGLGIGGLAVAFAAQKTLENLFGGITLLGDEVIRVGDVCKIGDRVGTVEDISLRSTRLRTVERSELSIPNGSLATMNLENLTRRDKILFTGNLGLRYETSADQLRFVLAEIRRMLYEHPKIDAASARIRFAGFADSALSLEIFCYILTTDQAEFTAVREDVLLRMMEIVEQAGAGFAFPSRTVYVTRDSGLDQEKTEAAAGQVRQWRDQNQLPFPDFSPSDVSSFRGAIEYPAPTSAVGNNRSR